MSPSGACRCFVYFLNKLFTSCFLCPPPLTNSFVHLPLCLLACSLPRLACLLACSLSRHPTQTRFLLSPLTIDISGSRLLSAVTYGEINRDFEPIPHQEWSRRVGGGGCSRGKTQEKKPLALKSKQTTNPSPPRHRNKREKKQRETEMATTTTICLLAAAMLLVSGASAQKKPCPRKFLGAQAEGLYAMPATAQQNATATSTNATYVVAEVANDTIALRSEGCYDITVHKCACDADLTEDACTDMGRIWTVHCECHLEELAG